MSESRYLKMISVIEAARELVKEMDEPDPVHEYGKPYKILTPQQWAPYVNKALHELEDSLDKLSGEDYDD